MKVAATHKTTQNSQLPVVSEETSIFSTFSISNHSGDVVVTIGHQISTLGSSGRNHIGLHGFAEVPGPSPRGPDLVGEGREELRKTWVPFPGSTQKTLP